VREGKGFALHAGDTCLSLSIVMCTIPVGEVAVVLVVEGAVVGHNALLRVHTQILYSTAQRQRQGG
jgi:hypothetical protein